MEMSLEGDLGIDSIKRVEILSAVQERAPDLPEVDAGAMAQLQTLGQILAYLDDSSSNRLQVKPQRNHKSVRKSTHFSCLWFQRRLVIPRMP